MNGGMQGTISSVLKVILTIIQFLMKVWRAWLSGQAMVNLFVHAYRLVICCGCKFVGEAGLFNMFNPWNPEKVHHHEFMILKLTSIQLVMINLMCLIFSLIYFRNDAPYVSIGNQETISSLLQVILAIVQFLHDMWQAWINGQSMGQIAMQASWNIAIISKQKYLFLNFLNFKLHML